MTRPLRSAARSQCVNASSGLSKLREPRDWIVHLATSMISAPAICMRARREDNQPMDELLRKARAEQVETRRLRAESESVRAATRAEQLVARDTVRRSREVRAGVLTARTLARARSSSK